MANQPVRKPWGVVRLVFLVLFLAFWELLLFKTALQRRARVLAQREMKRTGRQPYYPCVFFTYSVRDGMKVVPGLPGCWDYAGPHKDESQESFRVSLLYGALFDERTDFYLEDLAPIDFERVISPYGGGQFGFGLTGTHSYDKYLWSHDLHTINIESGYGKDVLRRWPWSMPVQELDRWVGYVKGGQQRLSYHGYPMIHYELKKPDGSVESYLPCDDVSLCFEYGYRNGDGNEVHFERDARRRLNRLSSAHQWLSFAYDANDRITSMSDSRGRTVLYSYNPQGQMVRVVHASGEVSVYTYDGAQRMLTFSAAPDTSTPPKLLLTNAYDRVSGRLTMQTFADGSTYRYDDHGAGTNTARLMTVEAPGGVHFDVDMTDDGTIVQTTTMPVSGAR